MNQHSFYQNPPQIAQTSEPIAQVQDQTFSMLDLFLQAEPLVKFVMIGLLIASIWSWAIIIHKLIKLYQINKAADFFEDTFWSGGSLNKLYDQLNKQAYDPLSLIFCSSMREWKLLSAKNKPLDVIKDHVERNMNTSINKEMNELEKHMTFLSSLGTNGVIIGLFGTVIGIMNSFENIAAHQNTNLAVVAPGIAEALFATAIGLVAAIPAAIAYNKLSADLNRYGNRLDFFCNDFLSILARQSEDNG